MKYIKINDNKYKKENIIFLDIDGVLNTASTSTSCGIYIGLEDKKIELLKSLVDKTGAKIVLVSSWKENWYKQANRKIEQDDLATYLDNEFRKHNLTILDKTIEDKPENRGRGILKYIDNRRELGYDPSFIILDDETFDYKETGLRGYVIQTSYQKGLLEKYINKGVDMLCKKKDL